MLSKTKAMYDMSTIFKITMLIVLASVFFASAVYAKGPQTAKGTITTSNVCVLYQVNNVYNSVPVMLPDTVSYRYSNGGAFLWLPGQDVMKVDYLLLTTISSPQDCVTIL